MSYEIDFAARYPDELKRREEALIALKGWLGESTYKNACRIAFEERDKGTDRVQIARSMDLFLGITGYPVTVWLDFLGFAHPIPETPSGTVQTQANT